MDGTLLAVKGIGQTTILGVKLTPSLMARTLACAVMTTLGMHYLNVGKKEANVGKMVNGVVLVLLGLVLCF